MNPQWIPEARVGTLFPNSIYIHGFNPIAEQYIFGLCGIDFHGRLLTTPPHVFMLHMIEESSIRRIRFYRKDTDLWRRVGVLLYRSSRLRNYIDWLQYEFDREKEEARRVAEDLWSAVDLYFTPRNNAAAPVVVGFETPGEPFPSHLAQNEFESPQNRSQKSRIFLFQDRIVTCRLTTSAYVNSIEVRMEVTVCAVFTALPADHEVLDDARTVAVQHQDWMLLEPKDAFEAGIQRTEASQNGSFFAGVDVIAAIANRE
jgi:hypothetical protein